MSESKDHNQFNEMASALEGISKAVVMDRSDLTGLANVSMAIENAEAACQDNAVFIELTNLCSQLCDEMMLAEGDEATDGCTLLADALEALGLVCMKNLEETKREAEGFITKIKTLLEMPAKPTATSPLAGESMSAEKNSAKAETLGLPKPDAVTIKEEEDALIYKEFINESLEHIESIEMQVLELETNPCNMEIINDIFRPIHSIKGASGFLGLTTTNVLCHEMETLLDRARKQELIIDQPVINTVLSGIDVLKHLISNISQMLAAIEAEEPQPELPLIEIRHIIAAVRSFLGREKPTPGGLQQMKFAANSAGEIGVIPGEQRDFTESKTNTFVKVNTERLDSLMDIMGELVIAQSQVQQHPLLENTTNQVLAKSVNSLSKITMDLQEMVMDIRMVPVRQTFHRMFRLVRDTGQKIGKDIKLVLSGEDTEIDKTVIEEIGDPLVHLLRNSVDHGIETPQVRAAMGKPEQGRIDLKAYHKGGNVIIEITDDGKGLDKEILLAKALERGLALPGQEYSESEIFNFIMVAGFSTSAQVTDVSGRGVGMDVVRRNIEKLGGHVDIQSVKGQGTSIIIHLPLTMAIVDGMIVPIGEERYVVPTLNIEESLRPTKAMISTVGGKGEMVMIRGNLVPILRLSRIFDQDIEEVPPWEKLIIVVSSENKRAGLLVDALLGQQQVVIKNLGERLRGIRSVSGGCILGDGRVALILDVGGLIAMTESL